MTKVYTQKAYLLAAILVFVGAILFSTKAVLVKLAYHYEVDAVSLLALRMLFALPFYLGILFLSQKKAPTSIQKSDYGYMVLFGVMGYYLASLSDFIGLKYITAGLERLILFSYPTLVLLLSAIFLRKKIYPNQYWALLLTYAGILITFLDPYTITDNLNWWKGSLYVFVAALSYAIYLIGSGHLLPRIGTLRYTSFAMSTACIAVLIHHGITQQWALFHFDQSVYLIAFLMAVIATVLPSFLIMEGIRVVGSSNGSIIGSVGPISTIIMAYIFLDERFGWLQAIGTVFVIGGVLVISLSKNQEKQRRSTSN